MAKAKITPAASASATVRGFADRIAPAFRALNTAAAANDRASTALSTRVVEAFVSVLAADQGLTPGDASKIVAEKCGFLKSGSPSVNRTWCKSFFDDNAALILLRRTIATPEAMAPADFYAAVQAYAKTINPRAAYEGAAKARKEAAAASKKAVADEKARQAARDTDAAMETGADTAAVPTATAVELQTHVAKCLTTLAAMDGGPAALRTLQAQLAALITPAAVPAKRQRRKAA